MTNGEEMEGKDDPNSEALGTVQHPNKCEMNKKKVCKNQQQTTADVSEFWFKYTLTIIVSPFHQTVAKRQSTLSLGHDLYSMSFHRMNM